MQISSLLTASLIEKQLLVLDRRCMWGLGGGRTGFCLDIWAKLIQGLFFRQIYQQYALMVISAESHLKLSLKILVIMCRKFIIVTRNCYTFQALTFCECFLILLSLSLNWFRILRCSHPCFSKKEWGYLVQVCVMCASKKKELNDVVFKVSFQC